MPYFVRLQVILDRHSNQKRYRFSAGHSSGSPHKPARSGVEKTPPGVRRAVRCYGGMRAAGTDNLHSARISSYTGDAQGGFLLFVIESRQTLPHPGHFFGAASLQFVT